MHYTCDLYFSISSYHTPLFRQHSVNRKLSGVFILKEFEFYQNLELKFPEFAICLEDSVDGIAKFYIPVLTPLLESEEPYDITDTTINTKNIINDTSTMNIDKCTESNYLSLKLPISDNECKKGDVFVILFISGDPNKPYILGRYYDAIN